MYFDLFYYAKIVFFPTPRFTLCYIYFTRGKNRPSPPQHPSRIERDRGNEGMKGRLPCFFPLHFFILKKIFTFATWKQKPLPTKFVFLKDKCEK